MYMHSEWDETKIEWFDLATSDKVNLVGTTNKEENEFTRLTREEQAIIAPINDGIPWLSRCSAGIQVKFETDSVNLFFKITLRGKANMSHMPATGQCGFDVYVYDEASKQYVLHNTGTYNHELTEVHYQLLCYRLDDIKMRKYIVHFPLYEGPSKVLMGIDKGRSIAPVAFNDPRKIYMYGTSIMQGGCVSRPGMLYSNIVSRALDMEVVNFGFSGAALCEKEIAQFIAKRPSPDLFIIDCEANAGVTHLEEERLEQFIDIFLEKSPNCPLILASRMLFAMDLYDKRRAAIKKFYRSFQKKIVKKYQEKGINITFLDGDQYFKKLNIHFTEVTVDGVHPTDLGSYAIAQSYIKAIKKVLL